MIMNVNKPVWSEGGACEEWFWLVNGPVRPDDDLSLGGTKEELPSVLLMIVWFSLIDLKTHWPRLSF